MFIKILLLLISFSNARHDFITLWAIQDEEYTERYRRR